MNMRLADASRRSRGEMKAGVIGIEAPTAGSGGFARAWVGNGVSWPCAFARICRERFPGVRAYGAAASRRHGRPMRLGWRRHSKGLRRAGRAMIAPAGRPLRGMQNLPAEFPKNTIKYDKIR